MGVIPKGIPRGCQGLITPLSLGYPLSVFNKNSTLTHTRVDPQPHMPYVIFRNMSPHFDSYANSGIPDIKGTEYQLHRWDDDRRCQLLHLLPHLQLIDVGMCMEHRIGDLQTLTTAIMLRTGKRPFTSRVSRAKWRTFLKCSLEIRFARRSDARLPYSTLTGGHQVCITRQGDPALRLPTNRGRENHLFESSVPSQRPPHPDVGQITRNTGLGKLLG